MSQPTAHVERVSLICDTSVAAGVSATNKEGGRMARKQRRQPTEADIAPVLAVLAMGREFALARAQVEHARWAAANQPEAVAA